MHVEEQHGLDGDRIQLGRDAAARTNVESKKRPTIAAPHESSTRTSAPASQLSTERSWSWSRIMEPTPSSRESSRKRGVKMPSVTMRMRLRRRGGAFPEAEVPLPGEVKSGWPLVG
jgi:hypothetical protein